MKARAVIRLSGRFNGATACTVTITDRLFTVRPLRRRKLYELPIEDVAERVILAVVQAEMVAKRRERDERRRTATSVRRLMHHARTGRP